MTPDDFQNRVFDKLDKSESKIDNLCDRTARIEERLSNHLTQSEKNSISRKEKLYIVFALIGSYTVGVFTQLTSG